MLTRRIPTWKVSKYGVISGLYFLAFGLNTKNTTEYLFLFLFSPNARKYGPEITPYLGTFQAVETYSNFYKLIHVLLQACFITRHFFKNVCDNLQCSNRWGENFWKNVACCWKVEAKSGLNLDRHDYLTLSWRKPLSYGNQSIDLRTGFYMITASVMKGLNGESIFTT